MRMALTPMRDVWLCTHYRPNQGAGFEVQCRDVVHPLYHWKSVGKMSLLVADYGSSGSSSNSEDESDKGRHTGLHRMPGHNLLTGRDASGSSDSDSQDDNSSATSNLQSKQSKGKQTSGDSKQCEDDETKNLPLPLPGVFAKGSGDDLPGSSVFANPFEQARRAKLTILEKHVKLNEGDAADRARRTTKNVCYKFQKGKCRFGDTCKFLHPGSEPASRREQTGGNQEPPPPPPPGPGVSPVGSVGFHQGYGGGFHDPYDGRDEDEEKFQRKRKDKAGLSEHLVPSKKALKIYDRQRVQERPWTVKR